MSIRAFITFIAGLLIVALVAGCGGSDDSTVSKSAFIEQADAICAKARLQAKSNKGGLADQLVEALSFETSEIGELEVPSGEGDQVEAILDGARKFVSMVEANGGKGTPAAGNQLVKVEKLANQYGFKTCLIL